MVVLRAEMITEPEWTPAGVCILSWNRSRSQYFRFEPESTLRSVQELIKFLRNLISVMMLAVVKQIGSFAIGNPERHVRKVSHRGSKQQ